MTRIQINSLDKLKDSDNKLVKDFLDTYAIGGYRKELDERFDNDEFWEQCYALGVHYLEVVLDGDSVTCNDSFSGDSEIFSFDVLREDILNGIDSEEPFALRSVMDMINDEDEYDFVIFRDTRKKKYN